VSVSRDGAQGGREPDMEVPVMQGDFAAPAGLWIARASLLDEHVLALQRRGRVGPWAPSGAAAAAVVGATLGLRRADWIFGDSRTTVAPLLRGMPLRDWLAQTLGTRGAAHAGHASPSELTARPQNYVSSSSLLGTQAVHAAGAALGMARKGRDEVALCFLGPRAAAGPDAHVALNFAGVFRVPVIFACISVSCEDVVRAADRADGYGIAGVDVDGGDAEAVRGAVAEAAVRARNGDGATWIEARVGPVDAPRVPVETDDTVRFAAALRQTTAELLREPPPDSRSLFAEVCAGASPSLLEQQEQLLALRARFGGGRVDQAEALPETRPCRR
jgi:hypothetical protein